MRGRDNIATDGVCSGSVCVREFVWPVRVYYDDTDAGGIVYHASYLKMMEHARTEWLRALGQEQDVLLQQWRRQFVVARMALDFVRPARFNDRLDVVVGVQAIRGASIHFHQAVRRGPEVLVQADVRVACLDSDTLAPARIPSRLRQEIINGG